MKESLPIWAQIVVAILSTGSAAAIVRLIQDQLRRRASRLYDVGYRDISRIYELAQQLLSTTAANRVLVLKSENGGGIPAPGSIVKSSVLHEVADSQLQPISRAWQMVPLDQDYSAILVEVNTAGRAVVRQHELHEGSLTRELLEAANASHSYIFRICATSQALLYLSVQYSSPDEDDPMSAKDHAAARVALVQLGKLFKRHHHLVKTESQP